jgi:hypothetical protein
MNTTGNKDGVLEQPLKKNDTCSLNHLFYEEFRRIYEDMTLFIRWLQIKRVESSTWSQASKAFCIFAKRVSIRGHQEVLSDVVV